MNKLNNQVNGWVAKAMVLKGKSRMILLDKRGEGTVSQAILILISVVLGALLLAGLYTLFEDIILPTLAEKIKEMFDYNG